MNLKTTFLVFFHVATLTATSQAVAFEADSESRDDSGSDNVRVLDVNCTRGETLRRALERSENSRRVLIRFVGTCREDTLIERDDLTISGVGATSILIGLMDVRSSQRITLRDLTVQGVPGAPFDTNRAGINIIEGSSATVMNVRIENIKARALQVNESTALLRDITIDRGQAGAFVFRASQLSFEGTLTATNSVFGMSLLYTGAEAKSANIVMNNNVFGLLVQVNGSLEHVTGNLTTDNNFVGIGITGHGVLAFGSQIVARGNTAFAILLDEGASLTPLVGSPEEPSLTVTDNPDVGISVERVSTCEFAAAATVSRNRVGVKVDNSLLRIADTTIADNDTDLALSFGAKAEFLGSANQIATPIVCDSTVVTRGAFTCPAP